MMVDPWYLPIFINNRDRVTYTAMLVKWLREAGYHQITILDNDSKYEPLLEWYEENPFQVEIIKFGRNYGKNSLWASGLAGQIVSPFVFTDPDIVPIEECPTDCVAILLELAKMLGHKVGLGLKLDDLPDHYGPKALVEKWESHIPQYRIRYAGGYPILKAGTDTTFAIYPDPKAAFTIEPAARTGAPLLARHMPWYEDSSNPTEENLFYESRSKTTSWGVTECKSVAVTHYCKKG